MSIRLVLADDQKLVRSGFSLVLSTEPDMTVVGEASDGAEAVRLVAELTPDVVLMDIQMPGVTGIEATAQITSCSATKVIVLTTFDREDYLFAALDAGASGFLLKTTDPDQLIAAIHAVVEGHALLSPEVTRKVIDRRSTLAAGARRSFTPEGLRLVDSLTPREREVLLHLGRGESNAQIAAALVVGEATIKTHVSNVLAKLQLRDRVHAVMFAYEAGLVG